MTFSCIENFGLRANIITQNVCSSAVARSLDCHLRPWCPAVVYPATQLCNIALAWSSEKILHHLYKAVTFLKCSTDQRMMPHKIINSMFPPMPNLQIHLVISVFFYYYNNNACFNALRQSFWTCLLFLMHLHVHAANSCTNTAGAMQLNRLNVNITTSLSVAAKQGGAGGWGWQPEQPVEPSAGDAHRGSAKLGKDKATTSGETPSPDC